MHPWHILHVVFTNHSGLKDYSPRYLRRSHGQALRCYRYDTVAYANCTLLNNLNRKWRILSGSTRHGKMLMDVSIIFHRIEINI